MFPVNSSQGDIQCITINLFNDTLLEVEENFVVELDNIDPVVTIVQDADLAIVSIIDVPDPQGKSVIAMVCRVSSRGGEASPPPPQNLEQLYRKVYKATPTSWSFPPKMIPSG